MTMLSQAFYMSGFGFLSTLINPIATKLEGIVGQYGLIFTTR